MRIDRPGERKAGNAGILLATTGGGIPDLLHTIALATIQQVTFPVRSYVIRKIMWYNNTGVAATLTFGTLNAVPAFVQLLPTVTCLNGFDGELTEAELPVVEFVTVAAAAAAAVRFNGNCYVVGSVAGIMVTIEVEEFEG
jgi:hypothetical protein